MADKNEKLIAAYQAQMRARYGALPKASLLQAKLQSELDPASIASADVMLNGLIVPEEVRQWESDYWGDNTMVSAPEFERRVEAAMADGAPSVRLRINSDGGDVFEASAIMNSIVSRREQGVEFTAMVDGMAASAASLVACACDEVSMAEMGMIMIHCGSTFVYGGVDELKSATQFLESLNDSAAEVYAKRTGKSKPEMMELMGKETYMNAQESVEMGFADKIAQRPEGKSGQSAAEYAKMRNVKYTAAMMAAASLVT